MIKRLILLLLFFSQMLYSQSFKEQQAKLPRVKAAYSEKWENLKKDIAKLGVDANSFDLYIRAFKQNEVLEVWLKSKTATEYKLFKTFEICSSSGILGPKRKQGDGQVPEGFYNVAVFNPYSSYHLSLGVSYPNESDKIIGKGNLGGDIMIHGNCVTIGCIPLTDNYIKEVYILAVEAKNSGQKIIPIHIFPVKFDKKGMDLIADEYANKTLLLTFWNNLKQVFDYFEKNKKLPKISVDKEGKYVVS